MNGIKMIIDQTKVLQKNNTNNINNLNVIFAKDNLLLNSLNELPEKITDFKKKYHNFAILDISKNGVDLNNPGTSVTIPINLSFEPKVIYLRFSRDIKGYLIRQDDYFIKIMNPGDGFIDNSGSYQNKKLFGFEITSFNSKKIIIGTKKDGGLRYPYNFKEVIAIG